jgi:hypothetical protein
MFKRGARKVNGINPIEYWRGTRLFRVVLDSKLHDDYLQFTTDFRYVVYVLTMDNLLGFKLQWPMSTKPAVAKCDEVHIKRHWLSGLA